MSSKGKIILIDGNSLLYRAFFAMPHFSTLENQPTNAVYGFTMMLLRLIEEEKPDILIVAFDAPVKTFRHDEFVDYKSHRKPTPDDLSSQAPIARKMVEAFNIPMLEEPGFEADDVIGALSKRASDEGYDTVVVTGDLDALQLVNEKVKVMRTIKGVTETFTYDHDSVVEQYGFHPNQFPDYKALVGDASDNIPGVPGIGKKTAAKLIKEFGSLENILENLEKVKPERIKTALTLNSEQAILSKRLAAIRYDVPIELDFAKCRYEGPDYRRLRELFLELRFSSLLKKLPCESQPTLFEEEAKVESRPKVEAEIVRTPQQVDELLSEANASKIVSIRIHGTTPRGIEAEPIGMAIAVTAGKTYYIPFEREISLQTLRPIFEGEDIAKQSHNLKYEYEIAKRYGIDLRGPAFDVLLASYLINPTRGTHTLESIALDYLGVELPVQDIKKSDSANDAIQEILGAQVEAIREVSPILDAKLTEDGLAHLMRDVEMPLIRVLGEMELTGVAVDCDWLNQLSKVLEEKICALEKEIYEHAGVEFNIGSPKQLQTILFDKLGLPPTRKTKTGYSTDAETLAFLAPAHEIVAKILEYRELAKLKSTYADSLPKLINPKTGRIHTSLNQAVTATGRLSSSEPNLQNIPIKTEIGRRIRKAFAASPGNTLIAADYSQIELRILAHVSRDPELIRSFQEDEDIHVRTAAKIFGVPPDEVNSDMRRQAKTVNFAVIYGMSEYGLSRELNIETQIAKLYIENYFNEYPGVKTYAAETLSKARLSGYVESLLGRRRYMPELNSPNRNFREFAERAAVNMPIQGTAADIVKQAMIRIYDVLASRGFGTKLVLQVHDELVFDAPESEAQEVIPVIVTAMEGAFKLDVPLKADVKIGKDWCAALPFSVENHEPHDIVGG